MKDNQQSALSGEAIQHPPNSKLIHLPLFRINLLFLLSFPVPDKYKRWCALDYLSDLLVCSLPFYLKISMPSFSYISFPGGPPLEENCIIIMPQQRRISLWRPSINFVKVVAFLKSLQIYSGQSGISAFLFGHGK